MNSFNHVADFIRFVTEALVILLAVKFLGIDDLKDKPANAPEVHDKEYLSNLSQKIVQTAWNQVPMQEVAKVLDAEPDGDDGGFEWCTICGESKY